MVFRLFPKNPEVQVNRKQLLVGGLKSNERLIPYLIVWLLCPCASNHAQCYEVDLMIIFGILNEIKIHWLSLICDTMMKVKRYTHYPLPYALLVSRICEYKGVDVSTEAFHNTHPKNKIGSSALPHMGFILQGNTYIHRDDVGNLEEEDEDHEIDDVQDEAGPSAPALVNHSYFLESLSRQLSNISIFQCSIFRLEVCSILRGLDDRVHAREGLIQLLDADDSDES
ncbi:hypothetical protein V8G54_017697 [Vigna mungo]|uniref:Uncharacterized protein n=1 Tax=Vigna mungo TaxID=3915 RepID=A0AAQ3NPY1_VIGMU